MLSIELGSGVRDSCLLGSLYGGAADSRGEKRLTVLSNFWRNQSVRQGIRAASRQLRSAMDVKNFKEMSPAAHLIAP